MVMKVRKVNPVMGRDIPFDISTAEERNKSAKNAAQQIRELQHALAGIEMIDTAMQLHMGLLMTQEALDKVADLLAKLPPLQPGDLDMLCGLRLKHQTGGENLDLTPGGD